MKPEIGRLRMLQRQLVVVPAALSSPHFEAAIDGEDAEGKLFALLASLANSHTLKLITVVRHKRVHLLSGGNIIKQLGKVPGRGKLFSKCRKPCRGLVVCLARPLCLFVVPLSVLYRRECFLQGNADSFFLQVQLLITAVNMMKIAHQQVAKALVLIRPSCFVYFTLQCFHRALHFVDRVHQLRGKCLLVFFDCRVCTVGCNEEAYRLMNIAKDLFFPS